MFFSLHRTAKPRVLRFANLYNENFRRSFQVRYLHQKVGR